MSQAGACNLSMHVHDIVEALTSLTSPYKKNATPESLCNRGLVVVVVVANANMIQCKNSIFHDRAFIAQEAGS